MDTDLRDTGWRKSNQQDMRVRLTAYQASDERYVIQRDLKRISRRGLSRFDTRYFAFREKAERNQKANQLMREHGIKKEE